ncbi:ATP-dependent DNA helicase DinG [Thermanaeromonas toyohensis ToBE]|uniref:3'-5' exonuclease DinG n=1 Tax=Thermanaeromonas toyohensis ToBE TaxID=698762 RepID=A0A1W1VX38_9FIRM|nr:helicase C-terminal domain-containing protein [Thermanaeromonas toyohensis]SMB97896.1 ATP-dependent DNA helicase DinG [Thermanaeromonas toyohensis ToBE]
MLNNPYVVVDLETTGLDPSQDTILEMAALRFEEGRLVQQFSTLVNPRKPIPPHIQRLTGIKEDMVSEAPFLEEVLPNFLSLLQGATVIAHNAPFDMAFLAKASGSLWEGPILDTLELSRILFPWFPSHKLHVLARHFNIDLAEQHRALSDAKATAQLLEILWKETLKLNPTLLKRFKELVPSRLTLWFATALSAHPPSSFAEVAASGEIKFPEREEKVPEEEGAFSPEAIVELLKPGGVLAQALPGYEYRPQQEQVLRVISQALEESKHALVEAGTGTGKSLAYLLPAIFWACKKGCRVAIATHTISLQEQLWYKDIPLLQRSLPFPFRAALLKGRSNYICRRRLLEWEESLPSHDTPERIFTLRIWRWLAFTLTGDWSEFKTLPEEEGWKSLLSSDNETCLGSHCPFHTAGCFVTAARRRAEEADIFIINHSLLLSDLRWGNQVLPPFSYLIVDEAHHLEDTATEHLAISLSQSTLHYFFHRLQAKPRLLGYLPNLSSLAEKLPPPNQAFFLSQVEKSLLALAKAEEATDSFFAALKSLWEASEKNNRQDFALRLAGKVKELPAWELVLETAGVLEETWERLRDELEKLVPLLEDMGATLQAREAERMAAALKFYLNSLQQILDSDEDKEVAWMERGPNGWFTLYSAPLEVGPWLMDMLFQTKECIVFTSATLQVNKSFSFFCRRTGLELLPGERVITCSVEAPFDYSTQAKLLIATDLPNPSHLSDEEYAKATAKAILDISRAAGGRTLVLCNSHRFLRAIYESLSSLSPTEVLLGQGIDGHRFQLIEEFCRYPQAILLGTGTFWEGIDLPGDLLRCLIIPRLPFPSPNVPVLAARLESLAEQGQDPFMNLSLPLAIIRFRQGFGRLIRRSTDRGAVVILDCRLTSKRYGSYFLASLPEVNFTSNPVKDILSQLKFWFSF